MICQSCKQHRQTLKVRNSRLIPKTKFNLCDGCINRKFEPRWAVVISARSFGWASVSEYIDKHLYVGEEITLKEVIG